MTGRELPDESGARATGGARVRLSRTSSPDACLDQSIRGRARLTAHRDADEQNFAQPIVSVSLGPPASFAFYGLTRGGKGQSVALQDGDAGVGGPSRLVYHAVRPRQAGQSALTGPFRYNLDVPARALKASICLAPHPTFWREASCRDGRPSCSSRA